MQDLTTQLTELLAAGKKEEAQNLLRELVDEATQNAGKSPLLDTLRAHLTVENQLLAEYEALLQETLQSTQALDSMEGKIDDAEQLQKTRKSLQ